MPGVFPVTLDGASAITMVGVGVMSAPISAGASLSMGLVSAGTLSAPLTLSAMLTANLVGAGFLSVGLVQMHARFWSAVVIQQPGLPACALVGRKDAYMVSIVDLLTVGVQVNGIRYLTRPMVSNLPYHMRATMGEQEVRAGVKRVRKVVVFGEGTLTAGSTITLHCDGFSETYSCTGQDTNRDILIYQEFSPAMVGRVIYVELFLNGSGIVIRDTRIDYIFGGRAGNVS